MRVGRFRIEALSEGHFRFHSDGSLEKPSHIVSGDHDFDIVGIDPMLVSDGDTHILLDAGIGMGLDAGSPAPGVSNLRTNLEIFDLRPEDISHVVVSHLHYDHVAGLSHTGPDHKTHTTLPNATVWVHEWEWDHAVASHGRPTGLQDMGYQIDDLLRLKADGRMRTFAGETWELIPGITLLKTGGHTPGHVITRLRDAGESAYYLGDLVPGEPWVADRIFRRYDHDPVQAAHMRSHLLRQAYREKALLLLYHELFSRMGRLVRQPEGLFGITDS